MTESQASQSISSRARYIDSYQVLSNAAIGVVVTRTREPHSVVDALRELVAAQNGGEFKVWDTLRGWTTYDLTDDTAAPTSDGVGDPLAAMRAIHAVAGGAAGFPDPGVYVMIWPHFAMGRLPPMLQCILDYGREFTMNTKRLVLVVPMEFEIPKEVEDSMTLLDYDVPSQDDLTVALEDLIAGMPTAQRPDLSAEVRARLVSTGAGMTMTEFENAISRAMVTQRDALPRPDPNELVRLVAEVKTEVVKRSDVLELMPRSGMGEVGGLDLLKQWVELRRRCFTEEAREFGIDAPKGICLVGPPGCLSGDTVLTYNRGQRNSGRNITLRELYLKFNGYSAGSRGWDLGVPTRLHSFNADTGVVFYNEIRSVIYSGEKPLVQMVTDGGRALTLTHDHPVLTEEGYTAAGELQPGDTIVVRGSMKPRAHAVRYGRRERCVVEGLRYYSSGWGKEVYDEGREHTYRYQRQHRARLVIEAGMNGMTYADYLRALREDPAAVNLLTLDAGYVVHHLNEDPMDDSPSNLCVMLKEEHDREHADHGNFNVEYTALDTVREIVPMGVQPTYDIQMAAPCNNFATADGLLVHNTGKSLTAKAIADMLGLSLIRFDVGRVFNSLVGSSEARVRSALKMVEAMAPCVVMLDELDKAFDMNSSGGDSGVGKRVLGAILTFMQESKAPIFWVMTANRTAGLPPEMLRKGRLDEVFSVTVPTENERLEVLRIHLNKRGHDPDLVDGLQAAVDASAGYVAAELEAAVKEALVMAFHDDVPVTGALIASQFAHIKPLSEAFAEDFAAMQEWAVNNARPSSTGAAAATPSAGGGAPRVSGRRTRRMATAAHDAHEGGGLDG